MAFLLLKGIPSLAGQNQAPQADPDDFVDRLNYRYTVILLNVFSAIVTNRQFSSKQIQCKMKLEIYLVLVLFFLFSLFDLF